MTCSWLRFINGSHLTLSLRLHLLLCIMILLNSHHIPLMIRIAHLSSCSYLSLLPRWIQVVRRSKVIHYLHPTWAILPNRVIIDILMLLLVAFAFLISLVHSDLKPKWVLFRVLIEVLSILHWQVQAKVLGWVLMPWGWSLSSKAIVLLHLKVIVSVFSLIEEINLRSASLRIVVMGTTILGVITVIQVLSLVRLLLSAWRSLPLFELIEVRTKLTSRSCVTLQCLNRILLIEIRKLSLYFSLSNLVRKWIWFLLIACTLKRLLLCMRCPWSLSNHNVYIIC
jgi:uncharacterized membrane protein